MITGTIVGNLGKDAEQKKVGDGTVIEFSVASTEKIKGEKQTTWTRCSWWNRSADSILQYLLKGREVAVSGSLALREYKARDGTQKASLEMRVDRLKLVGGGERRETTTGGGGGARAAQPAAAGEDQGYLDGDDIPF